MGYTGGCRAEFGIIEDLDCHKNYGHNYEPTRYNCIAICDDAIDDWWARLCDMPSFIHSLDNPGTALDRWGVTLIPPTSLERLIDVIKTQTKAEHMADALEIIELLVDAKSRSKFVIHYGV